MESQFREPDDVHIDLNYKNPLKLSSQNRSVMHDDASVHDGGKSSASQPSGSNEQHKYLELHPETDKTSQGKNERDLVQTEDTYDYIEDDNSNNAGQQAIANSGTNNAPNEVRIQTIYITRTPIGCIAGAIICVMIFTAAGFFAGYFVPGLIETQTATTPSSTVEPTTTAKVLTTTSLTLDVTNPNVIYGTEYDASTKIAFMLLMETTCDTLKTVASAKGYTITTCSVASMSSPGASGILMKMHVAVLTGDRTDGEILVGVGSVLVSDSAPLIIPIASITSDSQWQAPTTVVANSTTVGFQLVKPALTFGVDLSDSTTLAFFYTQLDYCTLVKVTWYADRADVARCKVTSFQSGSVKANMELTILNEGRTPDVVLQQVKWFIVPKSTTEVTTDTILDASFYKVSGSISVTPAPVSTTVGFQLVKPGLTFGADLTDPTTLAFISTQLDFCTLVKTTWYADDAAVSSCMVIRFQSGSVKANMQLTILNSGRTPAAVLQQVKSFIIPKSTAESSTDTILDQSFYLYAN